jgi:hypothetical protein
MFARGSVLSIVINRIISTAILTGAVALIPVSLLELRADWTLSRLRQSKSDIDRARIELNELDPEKLDTARRAALHERENGLIADMHSASARAFVGARPSELLTEILHERANTAQSPEESREWRCQALNESFRALELDPYQTDNLMTWALLAEDLGPKCADTSSVKGNPEHAIDLALELTPLKPRVLYLASTYYFGKNERDQAFRIAAKLLEANAALTDHQSQFLFSQIEAEEDVAKLIPGRFPNIIPWSYRFASLNPDRYEYLRGALETLQIQAVKELPPSCRTRDLAPCTHMLFALNGASAGDEVRKLIDKLLSDLLARNAETKLYLSERSNLEAIPIVTAFVRSDTQPNRNNLYNWGRNEVVYLDDYYSSMGFHSPPGVPVGMIELQGSAKSKFPALEAVRVYGSSDNIKWFDVTNDSKIISVLLDRSPTLSIKLPPTEYRYWKVHYSSAQKSMTFGQELRRLLRAFKGGGMPPKSQKT